MYLFDVMGFQISKDTLTGKILSSHHYIIKVATPHILGPCLCNIYIWQCVVSKLMPNVSSVDVQWCFEC